MIKQKNTRLDYFKDAPSVIHCDMSTNDKKKRAVVACICIDSGARKEKQINWFRSEKPAGRSTVGELEAIVLATKLAKSEKLYYVKICNDNIGSYELAIGKRIPRIEATIKLVEEIKKMQERGFIIEFEKINGKDNEAHPIAKDYLNRLGARQRKKEFMNSKRMRDFEITGKYPKFKCYNKKTGKQTWVNLEKNECLCGKMKNLSSRGVPSYKRGSCIHLSVVKKWWKYNNKKMTIK